MCRGCYYRPCNSFFSGSVYAVRPVCNILLALFTTRSSLTRTLLEYFFLFFSFFSILLSHTSPRGFFTDFPILRPPSQVATSRIRLHFFNLYTNTIDEFCKGNCPKMDKVPYGTSQNTTIIRLKWMRRDILFRFQVFLERLWLTCPFRHSRK